MVDRVSAANYATISGRRYWQNENLAAGIDGTEEDQVWFNGVQESVILPVEAVGIAPSDADNTQLWQVIKRMSGGFVASIGAGSVTLVQGSAGLLLVSAASGNVSVTLPPANALCGSLYGVSAVNPIPLRIVRTDTNTSNTVTIYPSGSDTLAPGGQTSYAMTAGEAMRIESDAVSAWYQISSSVAGKRRLIVSSSQNWTVPAWVLRIKGKAVGGGGGGAACNPSGSTFQSGGGGGAGGVAEGEFSVTPGQSIPITIAGGGAGGNASSSYPGSNGGTTSIGTFMSATGGSGANWSTASSSAGGNGGLNIGGDISQNGNFGSDGQNGAQLSAGNGASGPFGGSGRAGAGGGASAGSPGGGGGGAYSSTGNGGSGGAGLAELEY
jgi:hypothetical protein